MRSLLLKLQSEILARTGNPDLSDFREETPSSKNALSKSERYGIYEDAYWIRRIEAIAEEFDHLEEVLDQKCFRELIEAYVRAVPSRSWTLSESVAALPEFIQNFYPAASRTPSTGHSFLHLASVSQWDALRTEAFRASAGVTERNEDPFRVNPTARSHALSKEEAEYLRKTFEIQPLIPEDSDKSNKSPKEEALLLVWRNDQADGDYELEDRLLLGHSAKAWKAIESSSTLSELEARFAELAYDANSARDLFFILSSAGALK